MTLRDRTHVRDGHNRATPRPCCATHCVRPATPASVLPRAGERARRRRRSRSSGPAPPAPASRARSAHLRRSRRWCGPAMRRCPHSRRRTCQAPRRRNTASEMERRAPPPGRRLECDPQIRCPSPGARSGAGFERRPDSSTFRPAGRRGLPCR